MPKDSNSTLFSSDEIEKSVRVIKSLISQKYKAKSQDGEGESRIDYLADILGLTKAEVISVVERMRQEGILADSKDISVHFHEDEINERKSKKLLEDFAKLEHYFLSKALENNSTISYKQLNDNNQKALITRQNIIVEAASNESLITGAKNTEQIVEQKVVEKNKFEEVLK